jgi:hypothetical protein
MREGGDKSEKEETSGDSEHEVEPDPETKDAEAPLTPLKNDSDDGGNNA